MGDEQEDWDPCPRGCAGTIPTGDSDQCPVCEGRGSVIRPDPRGLAQRIADGLDPPAWWTKCCEVLEARAMIAQYGVDGWLRLAGHECPHPDLGEWLAVIESELIRLRHNVMVDAAGKRRKK